MEGQGNFLKTLLIAAAVYTLALGAPVKRVTSGSNVNETCAAARNMENLLMCTSTTTTKCATSTGSYNFKDAAEALLLHTESTGFNASVIGALQKCFNNSASSSQCELAAAAIKFHYAIKNFIKENSPTDSQMTQIHLGCNTTPHEEDVEQTLCCTSVYTLDVLKRIDDRIHCS